MILRYPSIFRLFHAESFSSSSGSSLAVALTPAAADLADRSAALRSSLSAALATKLHRLLMLSRHRSLLLSKLAHLGPDLGLPPDFRSRLCNHHPNRFKIVETSYGRALKLVSWDPYLASPLPKFGGGELETQFIVDRPPKFKQLKLRRGLNLKRRHRDRLILMQELPEPRLYSDAFEPDNSSADAAEKRACAAAREVLGLTVEKKTLVDHLTHFRKEFGFPNKLRAMLIRHPEMFYVSVKGPRDSVFLVEAYDEKGKLLVEDELLAVKEGLLGLVRESKKMRKERRQGFNYSEDDEDDESLVDTVEEDEDDDGLDGLFGYGIGLDWEEFDDLDDDGDFDDQVVWKEMDEFWISKIENGEASGGLEAW